MKTGIIKVALNVASRPLIRSAEAIATSDANVPAKTTPTSAMTPSIKLNPESTTHVKPHDPGWEASDDGDGKMITTYYEKDSGKIAAEEARYCLWLGIWVNKYQKNDPIVAEALAQVKDFTESEMFLEYYDPHSALPMTLEYVDKMKLGDLTGALLDYTLNCNHYHDQIPVP